MSALGIAFGARRCPLLFPAVTAPWGDQRGLVLTDSLINFDLQWRLPHICTIVAAMHRNHHLCPLHNGHQRNVLVDGAARGR
jgi:hypothetical protein